MLYNLFFLGGNWAYVQRYTSVKTPRDAKKVGLLFGALYTFSPILWMLPPMIYRVVNPALTGLENENAYLLMCRQTMPAGMLGLMLGGMIFATASSLNATLNISAGVFTNDIFKRLRPAARESTLMKVARISTLGFGVAAIVVALLIPYMGGIVNVVISVAALTGVPLYLPLIWSLFSQRLTGKAIIGTTLTSLAVNAALKFVVPAATGFALDRAEEMLLGVLFPALLLTGYESYHRLSRSQVRIPMPKAEIRSECVEENSGTDNKDSIRIIGIGAAVSGCFIVLIALLSNDAAAVPLGTGIVLAAIGSLIFLSTKKR